MVSGRICLLPQYHCLFRAWKESTETVIASPDQEIQNLRKSEGGSPPGKTRIGVGQDQLVADGETKTGAI